MSKHTPNTCQCGGEPTRQSNRIAGCYRYGCRQCSRSGCEAETQALAIADWNRLTAAPDLLEALKDTNEQLRIYLDGVESGMDDDADSAYQFACAALSKAEPKP